MRYRSVDPSDGSLIAEHAEHTRPEVEEVLAAAHDAHVRWRATPLADRTAVLAALADVLERDVEPLAQLLSAEMGKPMLQARAEVQRCVAVTRSTVATAGEALAPRTVPASAGATGTVRYDPIGVVLAVMPWNFPYFQPVRMFAPTVVGGNTVVLKSAPNTMGTGEALVRAAREAGLPDGLLQTLRVEPDVVADVIGDPRVQGVSFTGSTRGGRAVAAVAGAHGKRSVLELGGSDPFVVLDDADVQRAGVVAAEARLFNAGQSCIAAKRFIVDRTVADRFTELLAAQLSAAVVGDPRDPATTVGPMARADLRATLADQVARSVAAGARVVVPGGPVDGPGYHYRPTLLTGVTRAHAVGDEETFGPAGAVIVVDGEDAALAAANDTEYGLGASVWSADVERAVRFAARVEAGMISINAMNASDVRLPFGGVKASGYGRELGVEGMREFMNVKAVRVVP